VETLRTLARRHPLVVDALLWSIPALLFGALLRILLTTYLPYAYWNADSRSFYVFTQKFMQHGWLSLGDKRRYLYPLLLLPISYLPGGVLRWLPILQHAFGLITLVPLAYVVRKTLVFWRIWIVPITVIYAGLPLVLWCEHELLGDHLFFALFIWTFAGWTAWVTQSTVARAGRLFWVFLVPLALFIITKPHGRFVWPGLILGLCIVKAWKSLRWPHWAALALVLVITPTVGSNKQGAWLFYDAAFPLTRLDTPLHAEYKTLMRERVERLRNHLDIYHAVQEQEPYYFLRDPEKHSDAPLWKELSHNDALKRKIYFDLAFEAVKSRPDLFLYMGLQKVVFDANISTYETNHFDDGDYIKRTQEYYDEALADEDSPIRIAFAIPTRGPIPTYAEFQHKIEPAPDSWPARWVRAIVNAYGTKLDFFRYNDPAGEPHRLSFARPTVLGCWLVLGLGLSLLPRYRRTLGVWAILAVIYTFGVYIISVVNVHYIAPAWPVYFVILALPADVILVKLFGTATHGVETVGRTESDPLKSPAPAR